MTREQLQKWLKTKPWQKVSWEKRLLMTFTVIAAGSAILSFWPSSEKTPDAAPVAFDTHIPKGFVLIPIEVQNYESLDSILGRFGVVDLYIGSSTEAAGPGRLVARNVRIKAQVVGTDEREDGRRAVLNLGHTFAHAIESLLHGECTHGKTWAKTQEHIGTIELRTSASTGTPGQPTPRRTASTLLCF
jgi:hypothetical protein